jgi:hypothetical protein
MTESPTEPTPSRPGWRELPGWLLATLAGLVVLLVVSLLVAIWAGYETGEIVTFIGEVGAAVAAAIFAVKVALGRSHD